MIAFLARHKFLFDQGANLTSQLAGVANTSLIIVAASDKLTRATGLRTWVLVCGAASAYVTLTYLVGRAMDRHGFLRRYVDEINDRNEIMTRIGRSG